MAARLEEMNVTAEELERFRAAFQDARFRELLAEYAEEISSPENRRRYEQEISEMERQRGVDVHFLHPQPGHVLHTSLGGRHSCYLNVCSNGLVRQPQCVPGKDEEGRPGQHWSLPCSLSPAREQLSPEGDREVIYDVLFHPDTLHLASKSQAFRAMVDRTALETVAQSFTVELDMVNVRTTGETYRGVPQASVIRKPRPGAKLEEHDPDDPLTFPNPYSMPGGQKVNGQGQLKTQNPNVPHNLPGAQKNSRGQLTPQDPNVPHDLPGGQKNNSQGQNPNVPHNLLGGQKENGQGQLTPQDPNGPQSGARKKDQSHPKPSNVHPGPGEYKPGQEPTVPHYTVRHRSYVDMQDYRDARDSAPSPVPKELVITIDLPLLNSASEADLKIEGKALSLESEKPAYKLVLKLPYLVEEERGTAQFNKTKRQLVVTLPVVQQDVHKLMQEQVAMVPEPSGSPISDAPASAGTLDIPPMKEESPIAERAPSSHPQVAPECPIFTCSQDATSLTLVIHVPGIDEHSITSEVSSYQCELRFCVKSTSVPHVLIVQFLPQYGLNTDYIAVNVSEDNTVIELTKASECFGLWKNLYFGVDSNSLQERRFVNEDNVAEFLESGLRPSTIPWSTLEDQPLINVLDMNDKTTHIRLTKPELEEERHEAQREPYADLSEVRQQISYQSDDTSQSDSEARGEDGVQDPQRGDEALSQVEQPPCQSEDPMEATRPEGPVEATWPEDLVEATRPEGPVEATWPEDPSAEDNGLYFSVIPPTELEADNPEATGQRQEPVVQISEATPILQEVDSKDGSTHVISDHKTQCAFTFENTLLFELD